ncbi:hypothetical protein FE257_005667 [Aspergillus nanangensis]|uniref:SigF-like NTF2-like domain-containing protein n=1 Tax=Aspergillus nanangensis TaxID=2582783 RepID=A0AAD4GNU2_ASPNN|nr:hypothetical protein FE257_005667 [Aspergillus nanangensis]
MENPPKEIEDVIRLLTQSPPDVQATTIDQYFHEDAIFVHPLCRTWSEPGGLWAMKKIYEWYKVMSPEIQLDVHSIAYDADNLKLYVTISQVFSIWLLLFHSSPVTLTTVLDLASREVSQKDGSTKKLYYITRQEDFYQTSELVKFATPCLAWLVYATQFFATIVCILGAYAFAPIMWTRAHALRSMQRILASLPYLGATQDTGDKPVVEA